LVRPKVPLISRRNVLEVALKIIDNEGLDGLSIRRLAEQLGVNGASLYHHFANKEAIVVGAAELALEKVRTPERDGQSWREWLPTNARQLREALVEHPHIVPVVASWRRSGMGSKNLDASASLLIDEGVPSAAVLPLLDALEFFAIGSAFAEIHRDSVYDVPEETKSTYPTLARVLSDRGLGSDEIFDLVCVSILDGIERAVQERRARWLPDRAAVPPADEPVPVTTVQAAKKTRSQSSGRAPKKQPASKT
jgi:TetR/AcrR family transcriptional regulator, tetracycline repressor protein